MLTWKSCRLMLVTAALGAMAQIASAGCNCSVPPAPAAATGFAAGGTSYGGGYPMYGAGMGAYDVGLQGYGSPGSMSGVAYGGAPYGATFPGGTYGTGAAYGAGAYNAGGATWALGGYEARVGSPVYYHDANGGQYVNSGNPYNDHFGPGFQRNSLYGHYRFPYYNYRAPWYFPGKAVYNRDTNFPW